MTYSMTDSLTEAALRGLVAGYAVAVPVGALAVLLVSLTARTSFRVGAAGALGVATADGTYATVAVLGGAAVAGAVESVSVPLRWAAAGVLVLMAARSGRTAFRSLRAARFPPTASTPACEDGEVPGGTPPIGEGSAPDGDCVSHGVPHGDTPPDDGLPSVGDSPSADRPASEGDPTRVREAVPGRDPASARGPAPVRDPAPASAPVVFRSGATLGTPPRAYLGMLGLTLLNPWAIIYFSALTLGGGNGLAGEGQLAGVVFVAAIVFASLSWQLLLAGGGVALGRTLTGVRGRAVTGLVSSAVIAGLAVGLVLWG